MICFAADDDAQRDKGAEAAAFRRECNRTGKFQHAGHGDRLVAVAGRLDRGAGAGEQHVIEVRVEARLGDQDVRQVISPKP